jgi:heparosan-N-sulfate-glucuronate 5-epimerase
MLASPFYHRLHVVQLRVLARLTNDEMFHSYADKWEEYARSPFKRRRALAQKILFKIVHY